MSERAMRIQIKATGILVRVFAGQSADRIVNDFLATPTDLSTILLVVQAITPDD